LYSICPAVWGAGWGSGWIESLGISRNQRVTMHNNTSLLFAVLLILHLLLHWKFFWHINRYLKPIGREGTKILSE
jgi:hypothetical protein